MLKVFPFVCKKLPLLSKSDRLNKLVIEARDTENDHIKLEEFPGGAESFELAAKFCYGLSPLHITPSNVAGLRCAAEYLEMREDLEQGNLISHTEEFLSYVVLVSWLDSITVLRSCARLSPWAEDLHIVQRCVESIAWKASTDPTLITWSFTGSTGAGTSSTSTSTSAHFKYMLTSKSKLKLRGHGTNYMSVQSVDEVYASESTSSTENGQVEIGKERVELSNLERFCQNVEQQLGEFWRASLWRFPWKRSSSKHKILFNALSKEGTPSLTPCPNEGRTWNAVKGRRNSM